MNKIITISREFGSGGRELGRYIADTLKIAYYDQEIISELSKRTNLTENYIRQVEENKFIPLLPITTGHNLFIPVLSGNGAGSDSISGTEQNDKGDGG